MVQMDPTSSVARTEHLVLFSRLGPRYRPAELERLLWDERALFEYRAFILPRSDLDVHRETMRRYPSGDLRRHEYVRRYLRENARFRRYVVSRLRREGALRTRDFEDRSAVGWQTGGWNDEGKNTAMMLEVLWAKGEVMIVGREGQQRVWDLAERRLPMGGSRPRAGEEARRLLDRQLRALGIARVGGFGFTFEGMRPPGWERALATLQREGVAVRARVDGVRGEWFVHGDLLDRPFRGRTVLLSPFDRLIHDRRRSEELFGFRYRLEIYVPKRKREYGYFVMPILHGDRLIGRVEPSWDREAGALRVNGLWAEDQAPSSAGPAVQRAIGELATWLGARDVAFGRPVPAIWRGARLTRSHATLEAGGSGRT